MGKNYIKNPLTIIGIFAGIAEVAGTVVLPFINTQLQGIFIWYVMLFPVVLVIIFFTTLNWNNTVLYAPSDFENDSSFLAVSKIEKTKNEIFATIDDKKIDLSPDAIKIVNEKFDELNSAILYTAYKNGRMSPSNNVVVNKAIKLLTNNPEGMTTLQIAENLGITRSYASKLMRDNENIFKNVSEHAKSSIFSLR